MQNNLWNLSLNDIYKTTDSSNKGLTSQDAQKRIKKYGYNQIAKEQKNTALKIFINQFKNPLIWLLIFAIFISYLINEKMESIIILIIVIINSFIGFFQEYKSERIFQLLKKLITRTTKVLRDDQIIEINSKYVVPGDIVYLNIGDLVPADIRIIDSKDLTANESTLTGESLPIEKLVYQDKNSIKQDPSTANYILFMGTSISSGRAIGIVFATGSNTYFGKIAQFLQPKSTLTNFQKNMLEFEKLLLKIAIGVCVSVVLINTILGKGLLESIIFSLALAIGITPELLPVIFTLTLAHGAVAMSRKKVIIKKLVSIENLGNMNILCCDKTGTLTEGIFDLKNYVNLNDQIDEKILLYGFLTFADFDIQKNHFENLMDEVVYDEAISKKILDKYKNYKVIDRTNFDFTRRRISCIIQQNNEKLLLAKGSPDSLLKICNSLLLDDEIIYLSEEQINFINQKIDSYESKGIRVIGIAGKKTNLQKINIKDEKDLTFLGFLLFFDKPKATAKSSLQKIKDLGIDLKILSGDSPIITREICKEIGINIIDDKIITGEMIEDSTKEESENYYKKYNIFARITPEQKFVIITYLNNNGNVVGFLGDGVNDAPALKAAEVGISVNTAVDIAKESADVVLLKKSLFILAEGIIEGRKAFGNTTKYILNTTSANFGNIITLAICSIIFPFLPMLPVQILLTNLITDIALLNLPMDNVDNDFLVKPNKWSLNLIVYFMIFFGFISSLSDMFLMIPMRILNFSVEIFRSSWFIFSTISEILVTFFIRTQKPFYKSRPSYQLILISIAMIFFTLLLPYTNFGKNYFKLFYPTLGFSIYIICLIICFCISVEISKKYFFKFFGNLKNNNFKPHIQNP